MKGFWRSPLTYALIILNTLLFLIAMLLSGDMADIDLGVLVELGALYGPLVVLKGEWWRLLSAMFLHGGMTHLLMNMVSLYIVGQGVERYFSKTAYLFLYLFSGLIGAMVSLLMHPQSVGVGASGAIFGLFGALIGLFVAHKEQLGAGSREIVKDVAVILGLNLLLGLSIPSIDMSAHVGGMITGLIGGLMIARRPGALILFVGICLAALVVGTRYLQYYYVQIFI